MKIAQVNPGHMTIPPDSWGAVEKIIWYYKIESDKKGHEVHIRYINEIVKGEFDIVHTHMWDHALEMRDKGIPYIFTCHDHHAYIFGKDSDVYKGNLEAMINAEISIVPAKYLVEYFNNVPIYLRHGISTKEFSPSSSEIPHRILCVGNNGIGSDHLFDRKGFRYAIEAANELNIPITIVGPSKNNLNFFNANSDLTKGNVEIKYDLSEAELIEEYRNHTILIHPTSVEAGHPPLTILEAASCGLPVLTTDCSGDLYSIRIERDTSDVIQKIQETIKLYKLKQVKTFESVTKFDWSNVVDELVAVYQGIINKDMKSSILGIYNRVKKNMLDNLFEINFVDGASLEIKGNINRKYKIDFIDNKTKEITYSSNLTNNTWAKTNRKWFTDWIVRITYEDNNSLEVKFDLSDKRILISFESSSLGDTLAWMPYAEEFRKKHNCQVIVSTFHNHLFQDQYPNLQFVKPGSSVENVYALYRLGIFYDENGVDFSKHKTDFRKLPLQGVACDILGLDYKEIRPKLNISNPLKSERPYICIATHSTNQSNYWNNPTGWQELVDYVKSLGYDVYLLSREEDGYMGNKNPTGVIKVDGKSLEEIGSILLGSKGLVGLGSGLAWLAWGLGLDVCIISGRTNKFVEPSSNVYRVINENVCHGCFNRHLFDKGDWNWCPDHKGTPRQFECSKEITFDMVKPSLNQMLEV